MDKIFAKVIIGDSRRMIEVGDNTIDLVLTSPPYWHIKDYGVENQIGYSQSLHQYLKDIFHVWKECWRVLKPGTRLCINIGDQFLRSAIYGRYKIAPLHSEFISQCEQLGFDYMGSIIWQKKTTMNTTGGATIMGSFPYPDNGLIEIDYEYILIFKKPGKKKVSKDVKEKSKLSKGEWKEYFSGHWYFAGERQISHEAMFPEELPKRLIKMFTFVGDTVLDPFVGSGTTIKVASNLDRNSVGYEINKNFLKIIKDKTAAYNEYSNSDIEFEFIERNQDVVLEEVSYSTAIKDAKPLISPNILRSSTDKLYKVVDILDKETLKLDSGQRVKLIGVSILQQQENEAVKYLKKYVKGKQVTIKFDFSQKTFDNHTYAYVYLKNKIFVNKEMLKLGLARPADYPFSLKKKFEEIARREEGKAS